MNLNNKLSKLIKAAQGQAQCDLIIKNARYLDVFSCEWHEGEVALVDGVIVGVEPGLRGDREFDARGKSIVPGFIDAHVHIESSLMTPHYFQQAVLCKGTTTAICDPHEIANVLGIPGIRYFLEAAPELYLNLWVMLSSCVPATHMETNGGGNISAEQLQSLADHPHPHPHSQALGLAEMMNVPGVLNAAPEIIEKLEAFKFRSMDGHAPLLSGLALSAYVASGISSCHESSELNEAREKISKGMSVWIREGSVAKDLHALAPLLTLATSTSVGFCTDDRNPLDISTQGHVDHLVRGAIKYGVPAEVAYRAASWSVARHYGLATGPKRIGAIAPGFSGDLVILADVKNCEINTVLKSGEFISEIDLTASKLPSQATQTADKIHLNSQNTILASVPEPDDLEGPRGQIHAIEVLEGKIITGRRVCSSADLGVAKLSVLERYGHHSKPANAYVIGFGNKLKGAIASSVGHDSHNLIVVGDTTRSMRVALASLIEVGGGFCVVQDGTLVARLPLPIGGLMSEKDPLTLKSEIIKLKEASKSIGCILPEPFLQLAFLSLPVIPSLKLTDKGLVDVEQFKIIDVRAT